MTDRVDELDRLPAHPPTPQGFSTQAPQRFILMSPHMAAIGGLLAFFTTVLMVVVLPTATYAPPASQNWLPLTNLAMAGREHYMANGCLYCHSGFTRPQDVAAGLYYLYPRVSEPGDFVGTDQTPQVMGSERTGPDLSQEGGMHPNDWHVAHYDNPRNVQPLSIMPVFSFWTREQRNQMIEFNQENGGKEAILRYATVSVGEQLMLVNAGIVPADQEFPDFVKTLPGFKSEGDPGEKSPSGLPWMAVWMLNSFERGYWLTADPLPVTKQNLLIGKEIFLQRCSGCHGVKGDGLGAGAVFLQPDPFEFTDKGKVNGPFASDGDFYYRILTAGPGTAMENFGTRLSVQDIWRTVMFLRTIQNGSLADQGSVPTVDMFKPWTPPPPLLKYIESHPIDQGPGNINTTESDPFTAAAHWIAPGMAPGDQVMVGGQMPMDQSTLARLIKETYTKLVTQAYNDAVGRGEQDMPSKDQIMSTDGLTFHQPS